MHSHMHHSSSETQSFMHYSSLKTQSVIHHSSRETQSFMHLSIHHKLKVSFIISKSETQSFHSFKHTFNQKEKLKVSIRSK